MSTLTPQSGTWDLASGPPSYMSLQAGTTTPDARAGFILQSGTMNWASGSYSVDSAKTKNISVLAIKKHPISYGYRHQDVFIQAMNNQRCVKY
jgi:hypothetical protein